MLARRPVTPFHGVGDRGARTGPDVVDVCAPFTKLLGRPPLQYLADLRMQSARRLLPAGGAGISISEIAALVGYQK